MKIWEIKPPGTFWATTGLLRDSFTLYWRWRYMNNDGSLVEKY